MSRSRMRVGLAWFLLTVSVAVFATSAQESPNRTAPRRADGLAAWQQIHSVLIHPRGISRLTAVDYPQQGDERRRHYANVVRGPDGHGVGVMTPPLVALLRIIDCGVTVDAARMDEDGVDLLPGDEKWRKQ